jgi:hypothetical protein
MKILDSIDSKKLKNLITGIIAIYFAFIIGGVLHERILKKSYINRFNKHENMFTSAVSIIAVEKLIVWIFG